MFFSLLKHYQEASKSSLGFIYPQPLMEEPKLIRKKMESIKKKGIIVDCIELGNSLSLRWKE